MLTTVWTTLITVGGTLGGVVLGVILSNRYVVRQEKAKRNAEIIEEIYSQLMLISELSNQAASDLVSLNISASDSIEQSKEIYLKLNRIDVLISLYHPSLKQEFGDFESTFKEYWNDVLQYDARRQEQKINIINVKDKFIEKIKETRKKYILAHQKLQKSLEALVK